MKRSDKPGWQPIIGILPDGEVRHVLIDPAGWVSEDPTKPKSEYDTLMMALQILADARQIRVNTADEGRRVVAMDESGVVRSIKFEYTDKLAAEPYRFVESQAVGNDTHMTVTPRGRYWLEQWTKRKREFKPQ